MSTTSSLEGWEIERYIGPLSAHMVVATGILTDFFSGFSDVFGGKSASYQNKIQEIEFEALMALGNEAKELGADAIVGLRVDHDEIAAGGKSMMMVTAMGTAVSATKRPRQKMPSDGGIPEPVSAEALVDRVKRDWVLGRAADGSLTFSDSDWDTLIDEQIAELSPRVLAHYVRMSELPTGDPPPHLEQRIRRFFHALPKNEASRHLYDGLAGPPNIASIALKLILELQAVNLDRVAQLLRSDDEELASRALQTLRTHQRSYTAEDVRRLEDVAEGITAAFQASPIEERSRRLSAKAKSVWSCRCGNEVDADDDRCNRCGRDRYGFTDDQLSPVDARATIERRTAALRALLKEQEG